MKQFCNFIIALAIGCCAAANSVADDFKFEIGAMYGRGNFDSTVPSTLNGVPDPSLGVTTTSSDIDSIDLIGAWYYSGLSDSNGPKARAAFMSRASGVSVGLSRNDESGLFDFTGGGGQPPATGSTDVTTNALSVNLRHIWKNSGWYVLAGISTAELEASAVINGTMESSKFDTTAYSLGIGKYLGKATTLDLSAATLDVDGSSRTFVELAFSHVGSLGEHWQYGADLAYANSDADGDNESYALRGALYPSASFEFGLEFSHRELLGQFDSDSTTVFVGWFVNENVELAVQYQQNDPDSPPGADIDSDEVGIGVRVRF